MLFATIGQAYIFLATVYGGLAMGLYQDILGMLRRLLGGGKWITFAHDILFWLGIAAMGFYVVFRASDGDLRMYMILGFTAGFTLYRLSLCRPVSFLLRHLEKLLSALVRWILASWLVQKMLR